MYIQIAKNVHIFTTDLLSIVLCLTFQCFQHSIEIFIILHNIMQLIKLEPTNVSLHSNFLYIISGLLCYQFIYKRYNFKKM